MDREGNFEVRERVEKRDRKDIEINKERVK